MFKVALCTNCAKLRNAQQLVTNVSKLYWLGSLFSHWGRQELRLDRMCDNCTGGHDGSLLPGRATSDITTYAVLPCCHKEGLEIQHLSTAAKYLLFRQFLALKQLIISRRCVQQPYMIASLLHRIYARSIHREHNGRWIFFRQNLRLLPKRNMSARTRCPHVHRLFLLLGA